MSTHMPGFRSFLHHFVLDKLAPSSIRVTKLNAMIPVLFEMILVPVPIPLNGLQC